MTKTAFITFYKDGEQISKTIDREISRTATAATAAALEISWYNHPDKARVFIPVESKVYFVKISYKPHYANKDAEKHHRIASMTPEYKIYRTVKK